MSDSASTPPSVFRGFDTAPPGVVALYRDNHARQTVDFVRGKHEEYLPLRHRRMGVWDAIAALDEIVDQSDPDTELSQLDHALQTAEALRLSGAPAWLVLAGLIHDLGKVLCLFDEPQWAVVGDTFPVGCAFAPEVVYAPLFAANPDTHHPRYGTRLGMYRERGGLDQLLMSWGHDEYLYHVLRAFLPEPALAIIRYHSFYAAHREGAYAHLLDAADAQRLTLLRDFSGYDLYSKHDAAPARADLLARYEPLVAEFLPETLQW